MFRTVAFALLLQIGCAVTQTGNPSNDPGDGGPDASRDATMPESFDISKTEVLPSQLGAPVTPVRFNFDEDLPEGTIRVTAMQSDADALEMSIVPGGEGTAELPAFTGDWIRVQLLTASGAATPQDAQIGADTLLARDPSCLEVKPFVQSSQGNTAMLHNACPEELNIVVRSRRPASQGSAQPSAFGLVAGAEQSIHFTTTAPVATYDEFIIESSTGPPERATAVTVHFE